MGGKYRLSDRIRVSCAVRDKTGPGVIDLEIRNSDGLCARTLFRAQFSYQLPQTDEREWLVTLQGDPCEEYEVHVSYVDNTPVPAALPPQCEVMLGVIVDRGSPPGGASPRGAGEVSIQVNTDLLVQQIFPVPSRYFAAELAAPVGGYAIAPSIDLTGVQGWTPDQLSLAISSTGAADEVWVSFDGVNDEIHMVAGTSTSSFTMPSRARQVWIRTPAGVVTVQSIVTRTRAV